MFSTLSKKRAHAHNMYTLNSAGFFKKYNEDKMVELEKLILFLIIYHIEEKIPYVQACSMCLKII